MRLQAINLKPFSYVPYTGKVDVYDRDGNLANTIPVYGDAVATKGNISATQGSAQIEMFGVSEQYTKVILVEDVKCPIDESTVLFVDKEPEFKTETFPVIDENGELVEKAFSIPLNDYVVTRVAEYLNVKAYAIDKVDVS